jgi:putative heme-binding domain-containing protein
VSDLLAAAASADEDRFLHHAITFALLTIGDARQIRPGLASDQPGTARASLLALDQIPGGSLTADEVLTRLDSKRLRDTAEILIARHPEWDGAVAGWLAVRLRAGDSAGSDRADVESLAIRFAQRPAVRDLLAEVAASGPTISGREVALAAMATPQKALPAGWTAALLSALGSGEPAIVRLAVEAASSAENIEGNAEGLRKALRSVASGEGVDADLRLRALRTASAGGELDENSFDFVTGQLTGGDSVSSRLLAADVLQGADLGAVQFGTLADLTAELGPMELDRLLPLFAKASGDATGQRLVEALGKSSAAADAVPEKLQIAFAKFGPRVAEAARPLLERPQADAEQRRAALESLLAGVGEGDPQRGHAIFQSSRAACSACHAVGYLGGRIGPDLSGIHKIRTDRDLLEAILFPSASFVRSYEPVVVVTKGGLVHSGIPRDESDESVTLVTAADKTVTVPREEIEEMRPGTVSIMPAGLEKQLTPQELADLVAFLKVAR